MLRIEHQPAIEPVTLAEVKSILRLTQDADDSLISGYITAAREMGEKISRLSLVYKGYAETFESFPRFQKRLKLQGTPLISVTSVEYVDANYDSQEWDASEYLVGRYNIPGLIQPKHPNVYPVTANTSEAVTVHFYAGYSYGGYGDDTVQIPEVLRLAIQKLAAHYYDHPESVSAEAQNNVLQSYLNIFRSYRVY